MQTAGRLVTLNETYTMTTKNSNKQVDKVMAFLCSFLGTGYEFADYDGVLQSVSWATQNVNNMAVQVDLCTGRDRRGFRLEVHLLDVYEDTDVDGARFTIKFSTFKIFQKSWERKLSKVVEDYRADIRRIQLGIDDTQAFMLKVTQLPLPQDL